MKVLIAALLSLSFGSAFASECYPDSLKLKKSKIAGLFILQEQKEVKPNKFKYLTIANLQETSCSKIEKSLVKDSVCTKLLAVGDTEDAQAVDRIIKYNDGENKIILRLINNASDPLDQSELRIQVRCPRK